MRAVAVVLAGSLVMGCSVPSYRIPPSELARLAQLPPEQRGQHVRAIQEIVESDVPPAPPVTTETQIIIVPEVGIYGSAAPYRGGSRIGPGGKIGGPGKDAKSAAVAVLVLAATAMITAVAIEGSRFDGWVRLHPMQPVHLIGKDGNYTVVPLAWLDANTANWTETAVIRSNEGPFLELDHAPLSRTGFTYGLYGGIGSLRSADGTTDVGPAWTVQLGVFPTEQIGILASVFFGWRNNQYDATLFETRTTLELQYLPLQVGILHGGLYGGVGFAHRFEDAIKLAGDRVIAGEDTSGAFAGGAMFQLDVNTRIALTARLGLSYAHGEQMRDLLIGVSVY